MIKGKKLEGEVKEYLKKNGEFYFKPTDSYSARTLTSPVPADFIIFPQKGKTILLECKETNKPVLPLTSFRPSQLKAMRASLKLESCNYLILIKYKNKYYSSSASDIIEDTLDKGLKSINLNKDYLLIGLNYMEALDTLFFLNEETGREPDE